MKFDTNYANVTQSTMKNANKRRSDDLLPTPRSKRYNRFLPLATVTEDQDQSSQENVQRVITKPPPIIIAIKHKFNEILEILPKENCFFKKTSIGTKVFCSNSAIYDESIQLLKSKSFEFHTFRSKSNRLLTVYLHGLCKSQKSEIEEDLNKKNVEFVKVLEIENKSKDPSNGLYKVQFKCSTMTFNQLKRIDKINRTVVTWKAHKTKSTKGPMQCWKCLMFGHGGENCNRPTACMTCASNEHLTKDCNLKENQAANYKCFNCVANGLTTNIQHRANDPSCESRQKYLQIRNNALNKNNKRQPRANNVFNFENQQFPAFPATANTANWIFRTNPLLQNPSNSPSFADQVRSSPAPTEKQSLYSTDELFDIFQTAFQDLQKCQSRAEQIKVIASLLKHAI